MKKLLFIALLLTACSKDEDAKPKTYVEADLEEAYLYMNQYSNQYAGKNLPVMVLKLAGTNTYTEVDRTVAYFKDGILHVEFDNYYIFRSEGFIRLVVAAWIIRSYEPSNTCIDHFDYEHADGTISEEDVQIIANFFNKSIPCPY